jgi:hypothetical protein
MTNTKEESGAGTGTRSRPEAPVDVGFMDTGYQRSLLMDESATYNFLNATHPTENKRNFHA